LAQTKTPQLLMNPLLHPCKQSTLNFFVKGSFHDAATEPLWSQALNLKGKKPDEHTLRLIFFVSSAKNEKMALFLTFFGIRGPIDSAPYLTDPDYWRQYTRTHPIDILSMKIRVVLMSDLRIYEKKSEFIIDFACFHQVPLKF